MISEIVPGVWKISNDSNIYYIKDKNMLIDCGDRRFLENIKKDCASLFDFSSIKMVVFTHLHYDHCGCVDLFHYAKFYASHEEIRAYQKNPKGMLFSNDMVKLIGGIDLVPFDKLEGFEIIKTPGHTAGGICLLYKGLLFSGDTLFENGVGRVDLYSSDSRDMEFSLAMLKRIKYDVLCPGHDY